MESGIFGLYSYAVVVFDFIKDQWTTVIALMDPILAWVLGG